MVKDNPRTMPSTIKSRSSPNATTASGDTTQRVSNASSIELSFEFEGRRKGGFTRQLCL